MQYDQEFIAATVPAASAAAISGLRISHILSAIPCWYFSSLPFRRAMRVFSSSRVSSWASLSFSMLVSLSPRLGRPLPSRTSSTLLRASLETACSFSMDAIRLALPSRLSETFAKPSLVVSRISFVSAW